MTVVTLADSAPSIEPPVLWDLVPVSWLILGVLLVAAAAAVVGIIRRGVPGGRRRSVLPLRWRVRLRFHPGPGFAGRWELWQSYGLRPARKVAKKARPSLAFWGRRRRNWRAYATLIGRTSGWVVRTRVFANPETVILTFGGPRKGKSGAAADRLIDAPGPVVATSMRDDMIQHTAGPRSERGRIHVWNPEALGLYGSTVRWDPVAGCTDTLVAARRAGYMVEAQTARGLSDSDFWDDQTSMVLAAYLHAAALAGLGMREVYAWAGGTDAKPLDILRRHGGANPADVDNVRHFVEQMADRTQASIVTTLRRTLQFMRNPEVQEMLDPAAPGEAMFDIEAFLDSTDTLYLVSDGADSPTQPLFSALTAEIAYTARRVAAARGGRLDPPLRLELDEIANTAPVPAHQWVTWAGGSGVQLHIYAQDWEQLKGRYGDIANSLWNCAGIITVLGGTKEEELQDRISRAAGQTTVRGRDRKTKLYDGTVHREHTEVTVDVLPPAQMKLPAFCAIVLTDETPPTVVRTSRVWRRRDHRRWARRGGPALTAPRRRPVPQADPSLRHPDPAQPEAEADELQPKREERTPPPLRLVDTGTTGPTGPQQGGQGRHRRPDAPPPLRRPKEGPPSTPWGGDAMPWDKEE